MWEAIITTEDSSKIRKIKITQSGVVCSFRTLIHLWKTNRAFRIFYNELLVTSPYEAFYWEVAPMVIDRLDDPFEFVLIDSQPLKNIAADSSAFRSYFTADQAVVSFWNLGKDAKLVVPCPRKADHHYGHLANFVRSGATEQIDVFWQMIGQEYEQLLGEEIKWLSTAGLGVSWLHIRIDSRPKYYRYRPYKTMLS